MPIDNPIQNMNIFMLSCPIYPKPVTDSTKRNKLANND
jgi:hypothetical protein